MKVLSLGLDIVIRRRRGWLSLVTGRVVGADAASESWLPFNTE